jgi:hypothetical protein
MKSVVLAASIMLSATAVMAAPASGDAPSTEASGATGQAAPPSDAAVQAPEQERKICRTDKATGSLTRRNRICLTAAQWREVQDRTRRGVGELQGSASGGKECVSDAFGGCR